MTAFSVVKYLWKSNDVNPFPVNYEGENQQEHRLPRVGYTILYKIGHQMFRFKRLKLSQKFRSTVIPNTQEYIL